MEDEEEIIEETSEEVLEETQNDEQEISLISEDNNESEVNTMANTLTKIDRTEWADFLNTTPTATNPSWAIIGVGITDKSTDYNAETTEEKWIIEKNKRKTIDSYGPSSGVEQTAYKGDEVFEFVDNIRYQMLTGSDAETTLLEVDKYSVTNEDTTPTYRARLWTVSIEISSNGGDTAKINYNINYSGDPTFGTVTFSDGVPTFAEA